jgi:NAD(P)-dependent dehydrogenase (short-subunit alcohol dehydrogenase family)
VVTRVAAQENKHIMLIHGTTALITGANRGIGRSLVGALLERGAAKVYATGRRPSTLDGVVALDSARVVPLALDVTDVKQLGRAAEVAPDVDLLFNNAGVLDFGGVLDASADAFSRNFDVNCFGLLHTTRAFAPALEERHGAVVNMLTLVALASMPGLGVYNASKAAAWSLTQSLRADFAKRGVKVFGVFPGAVDTDMIKAVAMPKASPAAIADEILAGIEAGTEDIFPDPMSKSVYARWASNHKDVERQFALM